MGYIHFSFDGCFWEEWDAKCHETSAEVINLKECDPVGAENC